MILFTADWHIKLGQKNVPVAWPEFKRGKLPDLSVRGLCLAAPRIPGALVPLVPVLLSHPRHH